MGAWVSVIPVLPFESSSPQILHCLALLKGAHSSRGPSPLDGRAEFHMLQGRAPLDVQLPTWEIR